MAKTFFFYDLETSGVNPKSARIMQFAGQRTDLDLNPIGEPYNILVKLAEDVLPEPDAIMITGITPQQTLQDGITEAEFFGTFCSEIATPDTIFVGFNNIRFDDEFIRYGLYRNFYDPYEWQWKDECSKWDMLDVVRMTRALRPDGITWPFAPDGRPSNRLELLTSVNKLDHSHAHDAQSDVNATIAVAQLIKTKQPKLFEYLLNNRAKRQVELLSNSGQPFVYVSGKYAAEYEKLALVSAVTPHAKGQGVYVFDLRYDPKKYLDLPAEKLVELWRWRKDSTDDRLPVKLMRYNRCPSIAPLSTLRHEDAQRLSIDVSRSMKHAQVLSQHENFAKNILKAADVLEREYVQTDLIGNGQEVDGQLYGGFLADDDKQRLASVRELQPNELSLQTIPFNDVRMKALLPLYKARNFPKSLTDSERSDWEAFRSNRIMAAMPTFIERLGALSSTENLSSEKTYLIEELKLYAESLYPTE